MLTTHLIVYPLSFVHRAISILHFSLSTNSVVRKLTTRYKQTNTKTQCKVVNDFIQWCFFLHSKIALLQ